MFLKERYNVEHDIYSLVIYVEQNIGNQARQDARDVHYLFSNTENDDDEC